MSPNHLGFKLIIQIFVALPFQTWNVEAYFATDLNLVHWLNSQNLTWKAGLNPTDYPPPGEGTTPEKARGPVIKPAPIKVPRTFDSRKRWKNCREIISRIRDQGICGSCWAVAGASMLSDRTCIGTNASTRVHLSGEHLTTCCSQCLSKAGKVCAGGNQYKGIAFWVKYGVVTGGELFSKEGCKPYSLRLHRRRNVRNVPCVRRCTNKGYPKNYEDDKHRGKSAYYIYPEEKYIKREIFRHGPVVAALRLYEDFEYYKEGVYRYANGSFRVGHSVKIIGWGRESGEKYWLVANSWGTDWALMNGYFKIVRGENHCNIEKLVVAGRMSELSPARETLAQADVNRANRRSLIIKMLLFFAVVIRILEDLW